MESLLHFFSWLGDWERVVVISVLVLGMLILHDLRREATVLITTIVSAKLLSVLLKNFFAFDRPDPGSWLTDASGFSFPSGHATVAMALYGTLGYILWHKLSHKKQRYAALSLCTFLVVGVGLSRVALGVHWLIDVIGGWLLGGAVLVLVVHSFRER